ncbi:hypothetical protein CBR_g11242 [Chara braunii]|uniref:C3H1-type domain-containing protein n=1 Tax=Chara braunii TaxID=69332 RepID=A0A388KQV5_CHABU|nr:hypothetical protein CBR_g11242 [Chara braunii]|eukprot:GBG72313.1 hypothetical protein CBR_g11242 [Chara braunii]
MAHYGDLFKTRICRAFQQGNCDRTNCSFAHGEEELRIVGNNERRYMGEGQGQVWDRLRRPASPPRNVYRRRPSPHARGPASPHARGAASPHARGPASPGRPPPMRRGPPMDNRNRNRSHSPMYKRRRSNSNSPSRSPRPLNGDIRQIKRVRPDHGEQDYSDVSGEGGDDIPHRVASRLSPMSGGGGKDVYELQEQMSKMSAEKQELLQEVRALTAKMHAMEDALKRKEVMVKDLLTKLTVSEEKFQRLELQLREIVTAQIKVEKSKEHYECSQAELRKRLEEAMGENQADPVMKVLGDEDLTRRHPASTPKLAPGHGEGSGRAMGGRATSPGVRSKEGLRMQESVGHEREREQDREMERGDRDRDRDGEREKYRHRDRENGLRREKCGSAGGGSHGGRKHHGEDGESEYF